MRPEEITPLILTYNEAANIGRTLAKLSWAERVVLVDSGSTDETLAIARGSPQVDVIHRPFDSAAAQCNFGLTQIRSDWVLSMDADYELSDELVEELSAMPPDEDVAGYSARFIYRVWGRPLSGTLYPPRVVLYRRDRAHYQDFGHTQRVQIDGPVRSLRSPIYHDDRKPLSRWLAAQSRYAPLEADHLLAADRASLRLTDRLRLAAWPAPLLVLPYALIVRRCALDGWAGWYYVLQRMLAETLVALEIIDRRLRSRPSDGTHSQ